MAHTAVGWAVDVLLNDDRKSSAFVHGIFDEFMHEMGGFDALSPGVVPTRALPETVRGPCQLHHTFEYIAWFRCCAGTRIRWCLRTLVNILNESYWQAFDVHQILAQISRVLFTSSVGLSPAVSLECLNPAERLLQMVPPPLLFYNTEQLGLQPLFSPSEVCRGVTYA